jgi:chemotaxis protein MotB
LPKPVKLPSYAKNGLPQPTITTARATTDLTRVSERLASALQDELKRGTVVLEQRGDKLTLALSSGELFAKGRVTMTPAGTTLVKRIVDAPLRITVSFLRRAPKMPARR